MSHICYVSAPFRWPFDSYLFLKKGLGSLALGFWICTSESNLIISNLWLNARVRLSLDPQPGKLHLLCRSISYMNRSNWGNLLCYIDLTFRVYLQEIRRRVYVHLAIWDLIWAADLTHGKDFVKMLVQLSCPNEKQRHRNRFCNRHLMISRKSGDYIW